MGRGLSDLQKWVVIEANKRASLYYPEILAGFFGWEPIYTRLLDDNGYPVAAKMFSLEQIGEKTYRKTTASSAQGSRRLQERGLVRVSHRGVYRWSFVTITDKGREWLSVSTST